MNRGICYVVLMLAFLVIITVATTGQVQFQVPILFQGVAPEDTSRLWLGVRTGFTRCLDECDIFIGDDGWCENPILPPPPPLILFDTKLLAAPGCSSDLYIRDIRGYTGPSQIDTFWIRVWGSNVANGSMTISWPGNLDDYALGWVLKKKQGPNYITVISNMTTTTSYADPNAAYASQLDYLIISQSPIDISLPLFAMNPTFLDFGDVEVGSSKSLIAIVSNSGLILPLTVSSVVPPTAYSVLPSSAIIATGGSQGFTVTFTPPSVGTFTGNVQFYHDAGNIGSPALLPVYGRGILQTDISVSTSWNLVSVPRLQSDYTASVVFPDKNGEMYAYNTSTGTYDAAPTLANGVGYWVNYPATTTVTINGGASGSLSASAAQAGWVLVGSQAWQVPVSSLILDNGAVINGNAYRYNPVSQSYESTPTIEPGEGVWINVSAACTITIP